SSAATNGCRDCGSIRHLVSVNPGSVCCCMHFIECFLDILFAFRAIAFRLNEGLGIKLLHFKLHMLLRQCSLLWIGCEGDFRHQLLAVLENSQLELRSFKRVVSLEVLALPSLS